MITLCLYTIVYTFALFACRGELATGADAAQEIMGQVNGGTDMDSVLSEGKTKLIRPLYKCTSEPDPIYGLSHSLLFPEEYEGLSSLEKDIDVENMMRGLFELLDAGKDGLGSMTGDGGNGLVSREELAHRVYGVVKTWVGEDNNKWLDPIDTDADGLASLEELEEAGKKGLLRIMNVSTKEDHATLSRRFKAADLNRDGWLSSPEIDHFLNPMWYASMFLWLQNQYFEALDQNQDFSISKAEFSALTNELEHCSACVIPPIPAEHDSIFKALDTDQSGDISMVEFLTHIQEGVPALISIHVDCIFQLCDSDGDGQLGVEELASKHKVLTGEIDRTKVYSHEEL